MSPIVPAKRVTRTTDPAGELAWQIEQGLGFCALPEFRFHPPRRWRFDLVVYKIGEIAITDLKLAIEIEGGFFLKGGGRHTRGAGARGDCEKYNEAILSGWRVLRILPEWVKSGKAFSLVERAVYTSKPNTGL